MKSALGILLVIAVGLAPMKAHAYTVRSGFTKTCHEELVAEALALFIDLAPSPDLALPESDTWRRLSVDLDELAGRTLRDDQRFVLFSFIVGVRSPDTDGHSATDLDSLRRIHGDPRPEGQYLHGLRGVDDDGEEGDLSAVNGTRASIRRSLLEAVEAFSKPAAERLVHVPVSLDFYNTFSVQVSEPAFLLGRTAHTVQDSFSHTIRSAEDDLHKIATVLNFVDAISTDFNEERDGLAHSGFADECTREEVRPIAAAAKLATVDLVETYIAALRGEEGVIDRFLDEWVILLPGCRAENEYCGNTEGLAIVRRDPTGPYLPEWLICSFRPGRAPGGVGWVLLALLGVGVLVRQRQRSIRRNGARP